MARYRLKSREELVWNAVRRTLTAKLRLEATAWLEQRLNDELPALQHQFQQMLNNGKLPELEADHEKWVEDAVKAASTPVLKSGHEAD